jgi:AcrR family transcriptional regulator
MILALIMPRIYLQSLLSLAPSPICRKTGVMTNVSHKMASRSEAPLADGRRERSRSSRSKIVAAMLDLVGKGDVSPSAARVAEVAGVGLRSVFRHFDDMDELYREMGEVIEAQVMPIILQAPNGADWKEKLFDIADRRSKVLKPSCPTGFRPISNASSRPI